MKKEVITKIDNLMEILYKKYREKWEITDENFSKNEEIQKIVFEIVEILKNAKISTSYENLTNMNFHMLVKILNYNNFFKELKKEIKEALKKFSLLI